VRAYLRDIYRACSDSGVSAVLVEENLRGQALDPVDVYRIIAESSAQTAPIIQKIAYVDSTRSTQWQTPPWVRRSPAITASTSGHSQPWRPQSSGWHHRMGKPKYFKSPPDFRRWLEQHHRSSKELWVGFYRKSTGRASLTWPESVDEALCFGWIDGLRKTVDDASYTIRFSPRRPGSIWSSVNIGRAQELTRVARITPAGLKAFEDRNPAKSGQYSFENRPRSRQTRSAARAQSQGLVGNRAGSALFV
jgi:hypothetical protein